MELRPGELFAHGRYTLLQKLRSSGMAEIWLARQHGTEGFSKNVVIKRILPHLAEEQKLVSMFLDEAKIAANLNHPNVVQLYDLGSDGMNYFIAMEYIQGYDLEQILEQLRQRNTAFPVEFACRMIADTCLGLAYAHECKDAHGMPLGVVHRDVSPQNILVSNDGVVKLIDFGIAKASTSSTRTQHGHTKGKICYMSPEQMMAKHLDRRSDIFSAGVVLYELLCGQKPFDGENLLACFHKLMKEGIDPPRNIRRDLPPEVEHIVMRSMAKDREERYATANAMRQDLEKFLIMNNYTVGPERIADFLQWLFTDSTNTTFARELTQKGSTPFPKASSFATNHSEEVDMIETFSDPVVQKISSSSSVKSGFGDSFSFDDDTVLSPNSGSFDDDSNFGNSSLSSIIHSSDSDDFVAYRKEPTSPLFYFFLLLLLVSLGGGGYYYLAVLSKKGTQSNGHSDAAIKKQPTVARVAPPEHKQIPDAPPTARRKQPTQPKKRRRPVSKRRVVKRRVVKRRVVKRRVVKRRVVKRRVVRRRGYGYLIIDSNKKARVWLDGDYVTVPLLDKKKLKTGRYKLRFIWENKTMTKSVRVRRGKTTELFVKLK